MPCKTCHPIKEKFVNKLKVGSKYKLFNNSMYEGSIYICVRIDCKYALINIQTGRTRNGAQLELSKLIDGDNYKEVK